MFLNGFSLNKTQRIFSYLVLSTDAFKSKIDKSVTSPLLSGLIWLPEYKMSMKLLVRLTRESYLGGETALIKADLIFYA